jgi:hypothetical protein
MASGLGYTFETVERNPGQGQFNPEHPDEIAVVLLR